MVALLFVKVEGRGGVVTRTWVSLRTEIDEPATAVAALTPNFTELVPVNRVPEMVMTVPPALLPSVGEMELTVGAGGE